MRIRISIGLLALALVNCSGAARPGTGAAQPGATPTESRISQGMLVPIPDGAIDGMAVLDNRVVFGLLSVDDTKFHLWTMNLNGSNPKEVSLPASADNGCRVVDYLYPREISGDTVALNRTCMTDPAVAGFAGFFSVESFNPGTGAVFQLSAPQAGANPGPTTWNPDHSRGLAATGDGSCLTLIWLTSSGIGSVYMTLIDGNKHWDMSESFSGTCDHQGLAAWPAWSPDGKSVAFAASLSAIGVHGLKRGSRPWNIYLTNPSDLRPRLFLKGINEPRDLHWSHDGRRLAFSGRLADGRTGTWITDMAGRLTRVSADRAIYLAWTPSDDAILLAKDVSNQLADRSELRIVQLPTS
jgi:hypothetical protein